MQRIRPPELQLGCPSILELLPQLLGGGRVGAGKREKPVQVRVFDTRCLSARPASTAGLLRLLFAEEELAQPEPQAFLASPPGPMDQDRLREGAPTAGATQQRPYPGRPPKRRSHHPPSPDRKGL